MIKKLRRQIILINMLLVGVLLIGVFTALCVNSFKSSAEQLEHGLNRALDVEIKDGMPFGNGDRSGEGFDGGFAPATNDTADMPVKIGNRGSRNEPFMEISSYVLVEVDRDGNILNVTEKNATIDDDELKAAVSEAVKDSEQSGILFGRGLVFSKRENADGYRLALADSSSVSTSLRNAVLLNSGLFLGSMIVVFLISLWLSGIAVKPVKEAWTKQKQFVADASHELKTPLTVILANNNIMMTHKDSKVSDEQQWLESTEEEAQHMEQLIDQMLFLAKSDAGSANVELSDVDFSELAEGCALNFDPVAFEKQVMIDADIQSGVVLRGNPTQLNQLTHILVDNAVKYADEDTTVTISLHKNGGFTEFSVKDYGAVLEKDELSHIFDRFYRAEKSRTTKGYGLGLSIARSIVDSMNGKLTASSSKENGTVFTVIFK